MQNLVIFWSYRPTGTGTVQSENEIDHTTVLSSNSKPGKQEVFSKLMKRDY